MKVTDLWVSGVSAKGDNGLNKHRESKRATPYSSSYLHQIFTDFEHDFEQRQTAKNPSTGTVS